MPQQKIYIPHGLLLQTPLLDAARKERFVKVLCGGKEFVIVPKALMNDCDERFPCPSAKLKEAQRAYDRGECNVIEIQ